MKGIRSILLSRQKAPQVFVWTGQPDEGLLVSPGIQDLSHSLGAGWENNGLAKLSGRNANIAEVFLKVAGRCGIYVVEEDDHLFLACGDAPSHPLIDVPIDVVNGRAAGAVSADDIPEDHFQILSLVNRFDRAIPFPVGWPHVERYTTCEPSDPRFGADHIAFKAIGTIGSVENTISISVVTRGGSAGAVAGVVRG